LILIDTHVWIWFNSERGKLSSAAAERLQNADRIAISSISIYEVMLAIEKGRLSSPFEPETLVRRWMKSSDIARIAVSEEIVIQSRTLKFLHGDPFDRLIAATAVHENVPLMTADQHLLNLEWLATVPAQ